MTGGGMATASSAPRRGIRRFSFRTRLLLLVGFAVSLPALATCVVLGTQAALQAALLQSVATVAGIGALIVAAALLGTNVLAGRMLRPIAQLRHGAQRLGEGDLAHRIAVTTGDELETLADRFNVMASRIQESHETLEAKVEERTRDLNEALEYQTATSAVLGVISRSPNQVQPVLDTIVETAGRLCAADYAMALRLGNGEFSLAAIHGAPPEYVEFLQNSPPALDPSTCSGRTALDRRTVYIEDTLTEPGYKRREAAEIGNYRTIFGVPLLRESEVIGVICLVHKTVKAFTTRQIELVTTFADQAVIAIENVRLFDEVRARTEELTETLRHQTATAGVLQVISRSKFELQPVLDAIAETAARLCEAEQAFVFQRDGAAYRLAAGHGLSPEYHDFLRQNPIPAGRGTLVGRTASETRTVHIPDILADPDYGWMEAQRLGGFRTMLGVPLVREGEPIGVLGLTRRAVRPFSDKQTGLAATLADHAVIAIENVRLVEELQARTRELAQSRLRRFLAPQVAELLVASGEGGARLENRRCEVTVVFCDLRGFTAFAESAEPEEVMAVLREYHAALGDLIFRFEGTLERFVGDGLLVVFNDPLPCADHPLRAVRMAVAMRDCMHGLSATWRRQGHELGFGIGIAQGYATVGPIGFDRRLDYAVVGSIPNLASRLCDAAAPGQILVSQRVFLSVEAEAETARIGDLALKGFQRPVPAYEIVALRERAKAEATAASAAPS